MEIVGLVLVIMIVVGTGTGIAALINSYFLQKRVLDLYKMTMDLYAISRNNHEEIKKCQKDS